MEWLPIETAPKDGTAVLGYFGQTAGDEPPDMAVTRYVVRLRKSGALSKRSGWYSTEDPPMAFDDPTHWMPLPDPPQTTNQP